MSNYREYADYTAKELEGLDLAVLRGLFRYYRDAAFYGMGSNYVKTQLTQAAPKTPVEWIVTIKALTCTCERCNGSGIYSWGACINGCMTHSGHCNRCGGTGVVDLDDCFRNRAYDRHAICRAFAF
jgi:hypothetical protein